MVTEADLPVAVIGAGGSGLLAGAALSRSGVAFELLEARPGIGGTWRYDETGTGSACYASLVANTSKLRMSVAGRRIAGRPWHYAAHPQVLALLEALASDAGLWPSIKLGWAVGERAARRRGLDARVGGRRATALSRARLRASDERAPALRDAPRCLRRRAAPQRRVSDSGVFWRQGRSDPGSRDLRRRDRRRRGSCRPHSSSLGALTAVDDEPAALRDPDRLAR